MATEYTVVDDTSDAETLGEALNALAADGWKFVGVVPNPKIALVIMEREKSKPRRAAVSF